MIKLSTGVTVPPVNRLTDQQLWNLYLRPIESRMPADVVKYLREVEKEINRRPMKVSPMSVGANPVRRPMKKYNTSTGCYKIDLYLDGKYQFSTDQAKTCKEAIRRYIEKFGTPKGKLTASFFTYGSNPSRKFKLGDILRVSEGSGIRSGKTGRVVKPFNWHQEEGAYQPVPKHWEYLQDIKTGGLFTMPKSRLKKITNPQQKFLVNQWKIIPGRSNHGIPQLENQQTGQAIWAESDGKSFWLKTHSGSRIPDSVHDKFIALVKKLTGLKYYMSNPCRNPIKKWQGHKFFAYKTAKDYERYIRRTNQAHDSVFVEGILYTMDNYDGSGREITYGNLKHSKMMTIRTQNRYGPGRFSDAVVTLDELAGYRTDLHYLENKPKRWVYGTRIKKWVLVGPGDRDYAHGIPQSKMKKIGKSRAQVEYLSPHMINPSMTQKEFRKFYEKAERAPLFSRIPLPSGAELVAHHRGIYMRYRPDRMQAVTSRMEFWGHDFRILNPKEPNAQKWKIESALQNPPYAKRNPRRFVAIYDNGGKTFDRYTVVFPKGYMTTSKPNYYPMLGLSAYPNSAQGFSQWTEGLLGSHLGRKIKYSDLPVNVREHIVERMKR